MTLHIHILVQTKLNELLRSASWRANTMFLIILGSLLLIHKRLVSSVSSDYPFYQHLNIRFRRSQSKFLKEDEGAPLNQSSNNLIYTPAFQIILISLLKSTSWTANERIYTDNNWGNWRLELLMEYMNEIVRYGRKTIKSHPPIKKRAFYLVI
ncbi:hypothetical protein GQ43DRAFT_218499 [Delitschia confertaspora ATCC 74209]|uniref:Uncharacterized protein n=1 Tax=Delitschia confertaspora ATCC 74209 TaxID=1513339 RepID=A0A9P4JV67_9PLEO|nr:hypothetical protein GQ43DRAFT_218499 [Delitschia confertaspora ATCC 74209]